MMNEKWFALSIAEIEKKLKTNAASGLSRKAARSRLNEEKRYSQAMPEHKKGKMILELCSDISMIVLLIAAFFSLFFEGEFWSGLIILILIGVNFGISLAVYTYSNHVVSNHKRCFEPLAKVIRGGRLYRVDYGRIVTGDILLLEAGDVIGADIRLIHSSDLKVHMRVSSEDYLLLKKQAEGHVDIHEVRAEHMVNMLHAGSVIEQGSARGVVVAVGRYTYIGAMTQGLRQDERNDIPIGLKPLKKTLSFYGMLSLIAVFPISVIGLISNKLIKGTGLLSTVFLTALALSASFLVAKIFTVGKYFFAYPIRDLSTQENIAMLHSLEAFDRLVSIDYVFLLDGSALTDGILHPERAITVNGDISGFDQLDSEARYFSELVALYSEAEKRALASATVIRDDLSAALRLYVQKSRVDVDALRIRCSEQSFVHGDFAVDGDKLYFTDSGHKKILTVTSSVDLLKNCDFCIRKGRACAMSPESRSALEAAYKQEIEAGHLLLLFFVSEEGEHAFSEKRAGFVGLLSFAEGADPVISKHIEDCAQSGARVILFRNPKTEMILPGIPAWKGQRETVSADFLLSKGLPITYRFGEIDTYVGFDETQILGLLRHAHGQKKKVAVLGFSEFAPEVVYESDVFISCGAGTQASDLQSYDSLDVSCAKSCSETVKQHADALIRRPTVQENKRTGGLGALTNTIKKGNAAYRNLNRWIGYVLTTQWIRILVFLIPILLGSPELDARHLLLFSFGLDWFAFFLYATDCRSATQSERGCCLGSTWKNVIVSRKKCMLAATCSGLFVLILPRILGFFTDGYWFRIEFSFCAVLLLQLAVLYYGYFETAKNVRKIGKSRLFIAVVAIAAVLVLGLITIRPLGAVLDFVKLPILYGVFTIVPTVCFSVIMEWRGTILTHKQHLRK